MHVSRYNLIFDAREPGWFVLLNPLARSVDFLDAKAVEILKSPDAAARLQAHPAFLQQCLEKGYAYRDEQEERRKLEELEKQSLAYSEAEPLAFVFYLTFACNLRCTYCFESRALHLGGGVIGPELIDSFFRAVGELQAMRKNNLPPEITLFGGEPLLRGKRHEEAVEKILDTCKGKGYRASIITNGVELSAYAERLSRYAIENIQITVDGPKRIHDSRRVFPGGRGSFDPIVEGIDEALARGLKISLRINMDEQNVAALPELADFILEKGWLNKKLDAYVTPVNENGPESKVCLQQSRIETLKTLLDVKAQHRQLDVLSISHWLVNYFEHLLERGSLPLPETRFCEATTGTQYSVDYLGKVFTCC